MSSSTLRWLDKDAQLHTTGLGELARARAEATWVWIDLADPDTATLELLTAEFALHPLAIEDVSHYPQRPKVEVYASGLFIVWVTPIECTETSIKTAELDVFMGTDHLITVHDGLAPAIDLVVDRAPDLMVAGADYVFHAIVDRLVDDVLDIVDKLSDDLESIEDVLLENPTSEQLHDIYAIRRRLVELHRMIGPERDIIRALAREREIVNEEAYRYLQDVGDHLARVEDSIDTAREIAAAAMDIYLSSVSNRMNQIMKVLTVVATIFMPLTLISGIYGMNVIRGMWPPVTATWSFWAVVGGMAVIAGWMVWDFKRRKWW